MAKCEACENIQQSQRGAKGHDKLVQSDVKKARPFAQAAIILTYYTCKTCGTKWRYEDDRNDLHAGWTEE